MKENQQSDSTRIAYIISKRLIYESFKIPNLFNRADIVHHLIQSYGLLNYVEVVEENQSSEEELCMFHSKSYVNYLKLLADEKQRNASEENNDLYGIGYDCPLVENIYDFVSIIAGGTITAAKCLTNRLYNIAINWCGGWHHAQSDKAEGFCYVNDIVLSIEELRKVFEKILYIDFDIHHGDGVEYAYRFTRKVFTLSFHKYEPGFYPGTGNLNDIGCATGKYFTANIPLKEGITDDRYIFIFSRIFPYIIRAFKPNAIVVQCGADCITGDKLGGFNLTPAGIGSCVELILKENKPTLFVGGGGYNAVNVAKCWTYLTSIITNQPVGNDVPDNNKYFPLFGPDFTLKIEASNRKDHNTDNYLANIIESVTDNVKKIDQTTYSYLRQ